MSFSIPEPAAKRRTLIFTAGVVWILAGFILTSRAVIWLSEINSNIYLIIGIALIIGILKSLFVFNKIVNKNLKRIKELAPHKDKICIFAFQAIQSYLLVIFMISFGHTLRLTSISLEILSVIYLAIGVALFLSGVKYLIAVKEFS